MCHIRFVNKSRVKLFLCEKERRILFSVAVEFWDQNKTINTTRFVIWPQEQIYFQSAKPIFFASWILVVSPELWNWNLYPNIYHSASEFLLSNDQNDKRLNRRIPNHNTVQEYKKLAVKISRLHKYASVFSWF